MIEDCHKTSTLSTALNLQTAAWSPMSSMGNAPLHLQIADFKFSHTFVICDKLPDADFLFGIALQNGTLYPIVGILMDISLYKGKAFF